MRFHSQTSYQSILSPLEACYHAAHEHPQGVTALAKQIGKTPSVLQKKLNTNTTSHHLTLDEAMAILRSTKDHRILDSICHQASAVWFRPNTGSVRPTEPDLFASCVGLIERSTLTARTLERIAANGEADLRTRAQLDLCLMQLNQQIRQVSETARHFGGIQ